MDPVHYFQFHFVAELATPEDASALLDAIGAWVDAHGGVIGGGFYPVNEDGERIDARTGQPVKGADHEQGQPSHGA